MPQDELELEQRLARFEAQLDRFSLTLHEWQHAQDERQAVDPEDVERRIRTLEETVEREARALRRLHEEPLKQLQAQAASLSELCVSATHSINGLDQAESRLAALQTDLHLHLTDLSRSFQALAADLRGGSPTALSTQGPAAAWPLDRVVNIHDELRRSAGGSGNAGSAVAIDHAASDARQPSITSDIGEPERFEEERASRWWYIGGAAAAIVLVLAAFVAERRIESRLNDAAARAASAEQQATSASQAASRQILSTREEADRQISEARKSAQRAETIGAILTAPDLVRFALTGGSPAEHLSAQVLWSRSRGLVLSASRLPVAPPDTSYQVWLWANGNPVSAGVLVPDATGRATLVNDAPPKVAGPVVNVEVTVEPTGGRPTPSGRTLLARLQ